jgi:hypothetical protein
MYGRPGTARRMYWASCNDIAPQVLESKACDGANQTAQHLTDAPYPARKYNTKPAAAHRFHTRLYQRQCKALLYNEYPSLWKDQIRAVLSECNHHYPAAKDELDRIVRTKQAAGVHYTMHRPAPPLLLVP